MLTPEHPDRPADRKPGESHPAWPASDAATEPIPRVTNEGAGRHGAPGPEAERSQRRLRMGVPVTTATTAPPGTPSFRLRRSGLETVRDIVWIAVGVLLIAMIVATMVLFGQYANAVRSAVNGPAVPEPAATLPCTNPTHDEYGSFCPETPGG
jgi:hypothetical protein